MVKQALRLLPARDEVVAKQHLAIGACESVSQRATAVRILRCPGRQDDNGDAGNDPVRKPGTELVHGDKLGCHEVLNLVGNAMGQRQIAVIGLVVHDEESGAAEPFCPG